MFTQVMNLAMNAAILRAAPPRREPKPAAPKKAKATRQRPELAARNTVGSSVSATVQIYADAFKTAVYSG